MSQRSRFAYCPQMEPDAKGYITEKANDLGTWLRSMDAGTGQSMVWNDNFRRTMDALCEWWLGPGTILRADEKEFRNRQEWLAKQKEPSVTS